MASNSGGRTKGARRKIRAKGAGLFNRITDTLFTSLGQTVPRTVCLSSLILRFLSPLCCQSECLMGPEPMLDLTQRDNFNAPTKASAEADIRVGWVSDCFAVPPSPGNVRLFRNQPSDVSKRGSGWWGARIEKTMETAKGMLPKLLEVGQRVGLRNLNLNFGFSARIEKTMETAKGMLPKLLEVGQRVGLYPV